MRSPYGNMFEPSNETRLLAMNANAITSTQPTPVEGKSFLYPLISVVLMLIPLGLQLFWIQAFNSGSDQLERVQIFLSYLPWFFQKLGTITLTSLVSSITAIALAGVGLARCRVIGKLMCGLCMAASILLFALNVFQLM